MEGLVACLERAGSANARCRRVEEHAQRAEDDVPAEPERSSVRLAHGSSLIDTDGGELGHVLTDDRPLDVAHVDRRRLASAHRPDDERREIHAQGPGPDQLPVDRDRRAVARGEQV
jgi:hypothetical protein